MVCIALRYVHQAMERSRSLAPKTAAEAQWEALNNTGEAETLAFNPDKFSRSRVSIKREPTIKLHIIQYLILEVIQFNFVLE